MTQKEFDVRADEVDALFAKRLNKPTTNELFVMMQNYKYKDKRILLNTELSNNEIVSIILAMYPKATTLHTDTLDELLLGAPTKKATTKARENTTDTKYRANVKYLLPEEKPLNSVPDTEEEVEAAIISFLSTNKWRNQTYQQLLDKVAPNYKDKKYTSKSGKELSVFWGLLQNTINSNQIIKIDHTDKNSKQLYTYYKYCPERVYLHSSNEKWLDYLCKIINMGLTDIKTPLTQSEIYELVQIYCGTMRRGKVYTALKYMIAVGRLKTYNGACNRTYYYIDVDRDKEKEAILKIALLHEYL